MSRIKWNAKEYQAHLAKSEKELFAERQLPFKLPSEDIIHEMAAKHFEGAKKLEYNLKLMPAGTQYDTPLKEMIKYLAEEDQIFTFKSSNHVEPLLDLGTLKSLQYEIDSHDKDGLVEAPDIKTEEKRLDETLSDSNSKIEWHILNRNVKIQNDIYAVPNRTRVMDLFANRDVWQQHLQPEENDDILKNQHWPLMESKRLSFQLKTLRWEGIDSDPTKLSGGCYLLDFVNQKRISECFQFDSVEGQPFDVEIPQSCKFSDIVLIICLYKPFQGDITKWLETLGKGKVKFEYVNDRYVQPLAWQAIFLNDSNEKSYIVDSFNRYEDQKWTDEYFSSICKLRNATVRKVKQLPIKLELGLIFENYNQVNMCKELECFEPVKNRFMEYRHTLHFWPLFVNLQKANSKIKNVAIKIQICQNDSKNDPSRILNTINDSEGKMVDSLVTSICYHSRYPTFLEEFKIELPLHITSQHHILFTFYHISYKHKREDKIFAYGILPLLTNGALVETGKTSIPLLKDLPDNYLSVPNNNMKFIDKGKRLFEGEVKVSTTFLTQNKNMVDFFKCRDISDESKITEAYEGLVKADVRSILKFWPVVMDTLLDILCNPQRSDSVQRQTFGCFLSLLSKIHEESLSKHPYLLTFIKQSFIPKSREISINKQVAKFWSIVSRENGEEAKTLAKYSWFLFELVLRDILFTLKESGGLEDNLLKRGMKLSNTTYDSLELIIDSASEDIYKLVKTSLNFGKELNKQFSSFLLKLSSFVKPEFLFRSIWRHVQGFDNDIIIHYHIKIEFIKMICNSDYLIPLSLIPVKFSGDIMSAGRVKSLHFFPFLIQHCIISSIKVNDSEIRTKMLQLIIVILGKVEADSRYTDVVFKSRFFTAFFPTLMFACEIRDKFSLNNIVDRFTKDEAILYAAIFIQLLRYIDSGMIIKWIYSDLESRFFPMVDLLCNLCNIFDYEGKHIIEELAEKRQTHLRSNTDDAKKYIENSYKLGTRNLRSMRSSLKNTYKSRQTSISPTNDNIMPDFDATKYVRAAEYQFQEAFLTVLSLNNAFFELSKSPKSGETVFSGVFAIMQSLFECNQNPVTATLGLKLFGKCIQEHGRLILRTNAYCSELCKILLYFAASDMSEVRAIASENIYLLLKTNADIYRGNIGKIKTQLTVAISQEERRTPIEIKKGLLLLNAFAASDLSCPKDLTVSIQNMVDNLAAILHEKLKISQFTNDPELYLDMLSKLADEYQHTPDLRISMLETLATLHIESGYHAESGFGKLHCAALAAEYFKLKRVDFGVQFTAKTFAKCSSNITSEKPLSNDVDPDEEGICQNPVFSEHGLIETLTQAVYCFKKAQMYETAIETIKLIIPLYEKKRNVQELISWYKSIKDTYETISSTAGKRVLATYFRVCFKGRKFATLSAKDYIYKERNVTQLSEIVFRLTDLYKSQFGDAFEFINDLSKFQQLSGTDDKAYIYICFVEPYFDEKALKERCTYFERMHEIREFVFQTPFTKDGRAHGEVEDQYKRKTIMTTERPFPYMKKRISVTATREIEMSPIEVAIEAIQERAEKLKTALNDGKPPHNLKTVQLLLQGCVRPQVNKGPLEIANVFLVADKQRKHHPYSTLLVQQLKQQFDDLQTQCMRAVQYSLAESPLDQTAYNADLERGYLEFKSALSPLLDNGQVSIKTIADTTAPPQLLYTQTAKKPAKRPGTTISTTSALSDSQQLPLPSAINIDRYFQ